MLTAGSLQDWADQIFKQGQYKQTITQINTKIQNTTKQDYTKATSLQDAVDMMFNQGKYKK
jgi:hypothetical protein